MRVTRFFLVIFAAQCRKYTNEAVLWQCLCSVIQVDHNEIYIYLIKVSGDEGNGITSCSHLDEATENSVPHCSVLIHTMEEVTQSVTST